MFTFNLSSFYYFDSFTVTFSKTISKLILPKMSKG